MFDLNGNLRAPAGATHKAKKQTQINSIKLVFTFWDNSRKAREIIEFI